MPQMAPMNWTLLFLMFISVYLLSMIMIYFMPNSSNFSNLESSTNLLNKNLMWKW